LPSTKCFHLLNCLDYRVDEDLHVDRNERDYPRNIMGFWRGVKTINIDTAFQTQGTTYFFSGQMFYKFNDKKQLLELSKPKVSSQVWMGCKYTEEELTGIQRSARIQNETSTATSTVDTTSVFAIFFSFLCLSVCQKAFRF
jgi:Hemopexin